MCNSRDCYPYTSAPQFLVEPYINISMTLMSPSNMLLQTMNHFVERVSPFWNYTFMFYTNDNVHIFVVNASDMSKCRTF